LADLETITSSLTTLPLYIINPSFKPNSGSLTAKKQESTN